MPGRVEFVADDEGTGTITSVTGSVLGMVKTMVCSGDNAVVPAHLLVLRSSSVPSTVFVTVTSVAWVPWSRGGEVVVPDEVLEAQSSSSQTVTVEVVIIGVESPP